MRRIMEAERSSICLPEDFLWSQTLKVSAHGIKALKCSLHTQRAENILWAYSVKVEGDASDILPSAGLVRLLVSGAGADFVMLGGMLAGHSESGGEIIEKNGKKYKLFYGTSSDTAMKKHAGGVAEYRASEGKTVEVPYKGPVEVTIRDVLGGVRSTCTYVGAGKLKELSRRTTFIRVTQQLNTVYGNDG
eukprot:XP_011618506.1 PREDICTED: GMP reductase 2-like [Takifugu rubripes]